MLKRLSLEGKQVDVEISELRWVKGFGDATITKLKDNWINTISELRKKMEGKTAMEFTEIFTPIQFKQAQNYFLENPYSYV